MKIIFWGTPEIAVPFLEFLYLQAQVVAVITQSDKPAERGQKFQKTPVKIFAEKNNIQIFQPSDLKDTNLQAEISSLKPEVGIVVAYGKLIPQDIIQLFPKGIFNIHFSLLPHLRGAAPIQWSILHGDSKTGVTCFKMSETFDTGNIVVQKSIEISPHDNAITLEEKLVPLGILVLKETLKRLENNDLILSPQIGDATHAPRVRKEDSKIDWNKPADEIARQVRAFVRMDAFTHLPNGKILKILRAEVKGSISTIQTGLQPTPHSPLNEKMETNYSGANESFDAETCLPGTFCGIEKGRGFFVKCKIGNLLIIKVQIEGKKEADAWSFLQGARLKMGEKFT